MNAFRRHITGQLVLNFEWISVQYTREDLAAFETLPLQVLHTLLERLEEYITDNLARECANPQQRWEEALAAAATHPVAGRLAGHRLCMNFDLLRIIVLKKERAEIDALTGRAA